MVAIRYYESFVMHIPVDSFGQFVVTPVCCSEVAGTSTSKMVVGANKG